jgi:hypothetical protein
MNETREELDSLGFYDMIRLWIHNAKQEEIVETINDGKLIENIKKILERELKKREEQSDLLKNSKEYNRTAKEAILMHNLLNAVKLWSQSSKKEELIDISHDKEAGKKIEEILIKNLKRKQKFDRRVS